jgi:hypothetical protein
MRHGITPTEVLVILTLVSVISASAPRLAAPLDTRRRTGPRRTGREARPRPHDRSCSRAWCRSPSAPIRSITGGTPTDTQQVWGASRSDGEWVAVEGVTRRLIFSPVGITMGFSNALGAHEGKARGKL